MSRKSKLSKVLGVIVWIFTVILIGLVCLNMINYLITNIKGWIS